MSSIINRTKVVPGAKYRVCPWYDCYKPGAPLVGYGVSEKLLGKPRYLPIGWNGQIHPWAKLPEARGAVESMNAAAQMKGPAA